MSLPLQFDKQNGKAVLLTTAYTIGGIIFAGIGQVLPYLHSNNALVELLIAGVATQLVAVFHQYLSDQATKEQSQINPPPTNP